MSVCLSQLLPGSLPSSQRLSSPEDSGGLTALHGLEPKQDPYDLIRQQMDVSYEVNSYCCSPNLCDCVMPLAHADLALLESQAWASGHGGTR